MNASNCRSVNVYNIENAFSHIGITFFPLSWAFCPSQTVESHQNRAANIQLAPKELGWLHLPTLPLHVPASVAGRKVADPVWIPFHHLDKNNVFFFLVTVNFNNGNFIYGNFSWKIKNTLHQIDQHPSVASLLKKAYFTKCVHIFALESFLTLNKLQWETQGRVSFSAGMNPRHFGE